MLKIATDFEKFVTNGSTIVSAIGLIGGSKEAPRWVQNGNLQEDNVLAEAATLPCDTYESFRDCIKNLNEELESALPSGHKLVTQSTHKYTREFLMGAGPKALQFGCSTETQGWTGGEMYAPSPYTEMRTAGAHVHFSYENPSREATLNIIKAMDYFLGTWSVLHDRDRQRRSMYGTAGSCRIKDYGGEYRALSNFWVDDDELIAEVYYRTQLAVQYADGTARLEAIAPGEIVRAAINNYDVGQCLRIQQELNVRR